MKRWLYRTVIGLSALLCLASVGLWRVSHGRGLQASRTELQPYTMMAAHFWVRASHGRLIIGWDRVWKLVAMPEMQITEVGWRPREIDNWYVFQNRYYTDADWTYGWVSSNSFGDGGAAIGGIGYDKSPGEIQLFLPFSWLALLTAAIPALALRYRPRRPPPGCCPACGYDLRATPEQCPECGTAVGTTGR